MATILVIDDQGPIRALQRAALEGDGHEVLEASNGLLGLERSRERAADLVILDLLMPEMNGLELMTELNRSLPHVKVIAISGSHKGGGRLLAAKRLGAHRTFQKPFELSAVLKAVRDELAHEQLRMTPPHIAEAQQQAREWKPQTP